MQQEIDKSLEAACLRKLLHNERCFSGRDNLLAGYIWLFMSEDTGAVPGGRRESRRVDLGSKDVTDKAQRPFEILFIEDNPDDQMLMVRHLIARFPGVVIRQEQTPSGLGAALERGGFDLVITDYEMGWTNGIAVLREVKTRWPQTPVIVCSGVVSRHLGRILVEAGASAFVPKSSADFSELLMTVERLCPRIR